MNTFIAIAPSSTLCRNQGTCSSRSRFHCGSLVMVDAYQCLTFSGSSIVSLLLNEYRRVSTGRAQFQSDRIAGCDGLAFFDHLFRPGGRFRPLDETLQSPASRA